MNSTALPTEIAGYPVISLLGSGATAQVFKSYDALLDQQVAVKAINKLLVEGHDADITLSRFRREADAAGRLHHPNIVKLHNSGEEGNFIYLVMEYVEGCTLKDLISEGTIQFKQAINIILSVLDAIEHSHRMGVVHRDLKPANILVSQFGDVKVADFGIAKLESSQLTRDMELLGTPSYMAPEQITGSPIDKRADVFALGAVLYEVLAGQKAFSGRSIPETTFAIVNSEPAPLSTLNSQLTPLDSVIKQALAKNPDHRFRTCRNFKRALDRSLSEVGTSVTIQGSLPTKSDATGEDPVSEARQEEPPEVRFEAGQTIFQEGSDGREAYFIISGAVDIVVEIDGSPKIVSTIGRGEVFGEMALIEHRPRSASAIASEAVCLKVVAEDRLSAIIEDADPILRSLLSRLVRDLRNSVDRALVVQRQAVTD